MKLTGLTRSGNVPSVRTSGAAGLSCVFILLGVASCDLRDSSGSLIRMIEKGDVAGVKAWHGSSEALSYRGTGGLTMLHRAVWPDRRSAQVKSDLVKALLTLGADPNSADDSGHTVMMSLSAVDGTDAAVALINAGADVNLRDTSGQTALHIVLSNARFDLADVLLKAGANASLRDNKGRTPMHWAGVAGADATLIRALVAGGGDVNAQNHLRVRALSEAAANGHVGTLRALVAAGASVDETDYRGQTPLFYALGLNQADSVRVLLELGADPDFKDMDGATPLFLYATSEDRFDSLKALIEGGAELSIRFGKEKWTALDRAKYARSGRIIELLSNKVE